MSASDKDNANTVCFTLNGEALEAYAGESILQAAERYGERIPRLCYKSGLRAEGNCRACMVEIEGERVLAASCSRTPTEGMVVHSRNPRARTAQKMVLELLQSDVAERKYTLNSELDEWADQLQVGEPRFASRRQPERDNSHPAIEVNMDACIQCTRCLRACRELQVNDVIGYAFRGAESKIVFDLDDPMGVSSCVACGECVQACPTGALMPSGGVGLIAPDKAVDSVCPYCGVGCLMTYQVKDNRILQVQGRDGDTNRGRLCVKGRFGFDYVSHPHRLMRPLIRKPGVPKSVDGIGDPADYQSVFREASWEEALDAAAEGLRRILQQQDGRALAGFGSAKGSNEEAYLFQKLVRTGFGSNNVDHCTRLCHASSVAALLEGIGSGAVSNPFADVAEAEVIIVIGSNPAANHPVAASFIKNAAQSGKTLIMMDPRVTPVARHAEYVLQFNPDTDVALLNAMLHTIIDEDLVDREFVEARTEGFEQLQAQVHEFTPERMAPICGIDAQTIREVARRYATARSAMILWGMGVSQHVHGTDNARCLIALALITGQIGRPGTGLHPLRGQNNVQGASDVGLIPMVFPDYQRVDNDQARARFEALWQTALDDRPGLTVVEIMHAVLAGEIRGMYVMGENPAMSDPNLNHTRKALAALDHLVVQDLFVTETAWFADVVLPASAFPEKSGTFTNTDRRVQLGRQALELPGEARQDLWIIQEIARRLGLNWNYHDAQQVFEEMRQAMPSIAGITWERLQQEDSVTFPCRQEGDPGEPVIFTDDFPTVSGKGRLVPVQLISADEVPDDEYPKVLITGRQLEHWHTGSMTRRSQVLDAIEPIPVVTMHPNELAQIDIREGDQVRVSSRRGELFAAVRADAGLRSGQVFIAFCYHEAAANLLTNDVLDPTGKIPEFKYCAVRVEAVV
ncbi:formate dehydrogenase subunit alpha [Sedimenticola sp.]|uniref:formate dehydrogenase subunit alpha n=1 Tax=Sedimenticola sp. TaxID=1940285 RepID=UPI003D099409